MEDAPTGRVPFTYHFSYDRLPLSAEHCCANGSIGPLDVLPAGGTLRSPYYLYMREHLGLPTDHLFPIVDPRHPQEPLLLDLSGSLHVMCAHREEENLHNRNDSRVVLLRGVTQAGVVIHGHERRATLTLGWVDLEFPYYWGTSNRIVLLLERDRAKVLPDKTRLTVDLEAFLSLSEWTTAAKEKANHYRREFDAGRVPTFAETEAMIRFPPSDGPGVYGVYSVVDEVAQLVDLADDDTMREEYQNGLGLPVAPAPKKKANNVSAVPPIVAEVSRVHNVRYSGADMTHVLPRFDPTTLEPDPRLLQIAPIWQDKSDCRPWAELRDEMDELIHLRKMSFLKDSARPAREVQQRREDTDRALAERRRIYGKRAQDALARGNVERERPEAHAKVANGPPSLPPRAAVKRGRISSDVPVVLPKRRLSPRGMTSSRGSGTRPVQASGVVLPVPDSPTVSGDEEPGDHAENLCEPVPVGGLASTIGVLADAVDAAATGLGDATRQLQRIAALLRAAVPDNR